ncbi:MAG: hypothetical protein ACOVLB_05985 [Candidatus Nanopelagicus sp.]
MAGFFQDLLTGAAGTFFGGDYLRDYTHASKTFRPNAYQNAPKLKFLFHVYFEVNPQVFSPENWNYGLVVKTVKLPSFTFETAQMNQYNRKRIIQTKIKYDPVDISFHDDNGNSIRNMWKAYYNYYYADGQKPQVVFAGARGAATGATTSGGGTITRSTEATYNNRTQYQPSITGNDDWGYVGETSDPSGSKIPFFKNITVFGFNQHNFVAYTLINPVITRFSHDTYDYAQGNGTMEHQMGLDYETVVYNEGAIDGKTPSNIVTGFGLDANYDKTVSPIARPGANQTILGQGGLLDGAGGVMNALKDGNILGAIQAGGTTYNTFKNVNLGSLAKSEVLSGITNAVQQTPNRNLTVATPIFGATPSILGTAGAPTQGKSAPVQIGANPYAGNVNQ